MNALRVSTMIDKLREATTAEARMLLVQQAAVKLSEKRVERSESLISEYTLRLWEDFYRTAVRMYTNPFNVDKYEQQGERA